MVLTPAWYRHIGSSKLLAEKRNAAATTVQGCVTRSVSGGARQRSAKAEAQARADGDAAEVHHEPGLRREDSRKNAEGA